MSEINVPKALFQRSLRYLHYLRASDNDGPNISATIIAAGLGLNPVQVRKDLAVISSGGKPKVGYLRNKLIADLEHFLGYDHTYRAALVGAGHLGRALMATESFKQYGLDILIAFDSDPEVAGSSFMGCEILPVSSIAEVCVEMDVHIGIITTPAECAQEVCDSMIAGGIKAIWNFAPVILKAPDYVALKNEDLTSSFTLLSKRMKEKESKYNIDKTS